MPGERSPGILLEVCEHPNSCYRRPETLIDIVHLDLFGPKAVARGGPGGKGIAFLFLGCALFSTMWDNLVRPPRLLSELSVVPIVSIPRIHL